MKLTEPLVNSSIAITEPSMNSSVAITEPLVNSSVAITEPLVNSSTKITQPLVNSSVVPTDIIKTKEEIENEQLGGSLIGFIINPLGKYNPLNPVRNYFYERMFGLVEDVYKPNIHKAAQVIKISLPLVFAILTVNECCIVCKRPT